MEHYSIIDPGTPPFQPQEKVSAIPDRIASSGKAATTSSGSISAAIAAENRKLGAPGGAWDLVHPSEDGGQMLGWMAERDLDAALQLLAERAQYITDASGAAIALRLAAGNEMLCRASVGENAPGLGTLLSAESGLSGESVRTRRALRCDDAENDTRVNRNGCRELGIASVMIMPIANDDQVLGVFELFSGKVNAFGERDLATLKRLAGMVETAVKVTRVPDYGWADGHGALADQGLEDHESELAGTAGVAPKGLAAEGVVVEDVAVEETAASEAGVEDLTAEVAAEGGEAAKRAAESAVGDAKADAPIEHRNAASPTSTVSESPAPVSATASVAKKPLFWSAAAAGSGAQAPAERDRISVPAALRNLHKCQACNFPVSEGRKLCVECEEKQWRGQLRYQGRAETTKPAEGARQTATSLAKRPTAEQGGATTAASRQAVAGVVASVVKPTGGTLEARLAQARALESKPESAMNLVSASPLPNPIKTDPVQGEAASAKAGPSNSDTVAGPAYPELPATALMAQTSVASSSATTAAKVGNVPGAGLSIESASAESPAPSSVDVEQTVDSSVQKASASESQAPTTPEPPVALSFLGSGMASKESWLARNKFRLGALLVVGGGVAAFLLLR